LVLKLGGDMVADAAQTAALTDDLKRLCGISHRALIVHGGGPQATELTKRLGIERRIVGGRRVTDAATLEVMKMVLAGQVAIDLTAALRAAGLPAVGLSGVSGVIEAVKRPPRVVSGCGPDPVDFGLVGDIEAIHTEPLRALVRAGMLPVLNSLGADAAGQVFNINADIAATRVAAALGASRLVLLTGKVPGVLRDPADPGTRIPRLTSAEARLAIADGTIVGGMIPKIEESLAVLDSVDTVHIMGRVEPGALLRELKRPGDVGTALISG